VGKLPDDFSEWRIPWKDDEFDSEKAARIVFNARKAEEKANDKVKEREAEITRLTTELDTAKAAKSGTDEDAQRELKDLRKENRELKEASGKSLPADEKKIQQLRAALKYGLSEKQALRLQGDDEDGIFEDAKDFADELGIEYDDPDGGQGENGGESGGQGQGQTSAQPPVQQPASRFKTGAPGADQVNVVSDPKAAAAKLPALFG
jgi:hypothetical protein